MVRIQRKRLGLGMKGRFVADDKSTPNVDESKKRVYKSRKVKKVKE